MSNYIKPNTITEDLLSYDLRTRLRRLESATKYVTENSNTITDHKDTLNRNSASSHPASAINTDITNFNNNLTSSETDVQKALDKIDDLVIGSSGDNFEIIEITEFVDYDSSFRYDTANKEVIYVKPTDDVTNYRIYLENNTAFKLGYKCHIFWEGAASNDSSYLEVAIKKPDDSFHFERIYKHTMKSYVWTNTYKWLGFSNRNIDFGGYGNYDFKAPARAYGLNSLSFGSNAVSSNGGLAFGTDSRSDYQGGIAIGKSANANNFSLALGDESVCNDKYQMARGGFRTTANRMSEESRNINITETTKHFAGRVQWSGTIATIIGFYEMFLYGVAGKRFTTSDHSVITGFLKLHMIRMAGGGETYSTTRSVTIKRDSGVATVTILRNQVIDTYNADVGILDFNLVANTATGNIEVFVQSGSAVRAYDTRISCEFDYIETIV